MVTEIVAGVYLLSGFLGAGVWGANAYLLVDNGDLTLVDTGFAGRADLISEQIMKLGYAPSDVKRIIITHHHSDHTGNLAKLKRITGAEVIAHPADAPYIDGTMLQPGPARPQWLGKFLSRFSWLWSTEPVAVDLLVNDGQELPILGGIKIIYTPGHTPGSICLYLQDKKLLIAGDLLANRFCVRLPSRGFTVDIVQEIKSIKRLAGLEFDTICFGHGAPIMHNADQVVADFASKLTSSAISNK
jgi:glyoxylase-like metal-dependent hydrolase (beta-lactamase superfamily II)